MSMEQIYEDAIKDPSQEPKSYCVKPTTVRLRQ